MTDAMQPPQHPQAEPDYPADSNVTMGVWNTERGGYSSYTPDTDEPEREAAIFQEVKKLRLGGVAAMGLTDTFGWKQRYGSNVQIAERLGYAQAHFEPLDDLPLVYRDGPGHGNVFATNVTSAIDTLDLGTSRGIRAIMDVGAAGLQIAFVNLNDHSEEVRIKQLAAMFSRDGLERGIPTILMGSFHSLPRELPTNLRDRVGDLAVRLMGNVLPGGSELGERARAADERLVIPRLAIAGFWDANTDHVATTSIGPGHLGATDHVLHNNLVDVSGFAVMPNKGASLHQAIRFRAQTRLAA